MKILKPKVAVVSDIHAGVHQNSTQWHDILISWSEWFKQECIKHDIADIIIPGDILHERNEVNVATLSVVSRMFESLKQFNIIIVVGNHDSYYKERSDVHSLEMLKNWDNITVVDSIYSDKFFGKTISFCPWASDPSNLPKSDIIFGHFEIQGFNMTKERVCESGLSPINILDKADLTISGHFHGKDERTFNNKTILYTGCAFELYWGDYSSDKGYYIIDVTDNSYKFYENTISPKHKKIYVSDIKKNGLTNDIKQIIPNNWIKIIVDIKVNPDALIAITEKLKILNPLDIKIDYITDSVDISPGDDLNITGVDTVKSIHEYIENIDIPYKSEVETYIIETYKKVS